MSFWVQIKRRKVFQVIVAYGVAAWLLTQIVTTIEEPMGWPDGVDTWVIRALLVAFPIVIVVSWAFDLTARGFVRDTGDRSTGVGKSTEIALVGVVTLASGWMAYAAIRGDLFDVADNRLPNSVAILPFANLSPDPENRYIADGIHEEVLDALQKIGSLNVISRTSVLRYRDGLTPIRDIARDLNVETVVEGSLRFANGRLRIATQVIDGRTEAHISSEIYERSFDDYFGIQSSFARDIVAQLEVDLTDEESQRLDRPPTNSPQAYALYLQARAAWGTDREAVDRYLERAIELDPDFAVAYATKAGNFAQNMINTFGASANDEGPDALYQRVQDLAAKALEIDPSLGQAYGAVGTAHRNYWRWTEAREAFEQGRRIDPSERGDAWFFSFLGEHELALDIVADWVKLDPNDPFARYYRGACQLWARRTEDAIASFREAIALDPVGARYHLLLARAHLQNRDNRSALEELRIAREIWGENLIPLIMVELAYIYARVGEDDEAAGLINRFEAIADESAGAGTWILAELARGDETEALRWLNIAVDKIDSHRPDAGFYSLMMIKLNETLDPVLEQPDFVSLRNRIRGS